jgi:hypothetical protein
MVATLPCYEEPFERGTFRASAGDLTLTARRDRAVLLVGWAGALRRSELVAFGAEDVFSSYAKAARGFQDPPPPKTLGFESRQRLSLSSLRGRAALRK